MYRLLLISLASVLMLTGSHALADDSRGTEPSDIALGPPTNPLYEKAQTLLDSDKLTKSARRTIGGLSETWRKNGAPLPRAWDDLEEIPKGTMKAELMNGQMLKLGEEVQAKMKASVTIPESVDGQFVVEAHIISRGGGSSIIMLGRSQQPTEFQLKGSRRTTKSGSYQALYILAVRTIKDAKVKVLDVAELSYTVLADE